MKNGKTFSRFIIPILLVGMIVTFVGCRGAPSARGVEWTADFARTSFTADDTSMYHNNRPVSIRAPYMQNGVLMAPYDAAQTAFGRDTTWNLSGSTLTVARGNTSVVLTTGSDVMRVGNNTLTLPAAPEMRSGVLFLPIAALADQFEDVYANWAPDHIVPGSTESNSEARVLVVTSGVAMPNTDPGSVSYGNKNSQFEQWYGGSPESFRLAENVLLYQHNDGGWNYYIGDDHTNFGLVLTAEQIVSAIEGKSSTSYRGTLDDDATIPEIRYLIRMYQATNIERYREAYMKAINLVLDAQYDNGGFPQQLSRPNSYNGEITFNDNAMTNAITLWIDMQNNPNSFFSISRETMQKTRASLISAIDCILDAQIYSEAMGMLTAWCAQHDRDTLAPVWAREFEPPSISGTESINLLRFLTSLERDFLVSLGTAPGETKSTWERVQNSIHAAAYFFPKAEIFGLTHTTGTNSFGQTNDRVLAENPTGRSLWGRFIDIDTFQPLFFDRVNPTFQTNNAANRAEEAGYDRNILGPRMEGKWRPAGGNNRVIFNTDGSMDIPASYARLSSERRNGYSYVNSEAGAVPGMYRSWLQRNGLPIPVSNIEGIYATYERGNITLNGVVVPANAAQRNITWTVVNAGTAGASLSGNVVNASRLGTFTVRATITGGMYDGTAYVQDFTIEAVQDISVTDIFGVPAFLPIGSYDFTKLQVMPLNAPGRNITWSVTNAGTTGAAFSNGFLTTNAPGTVALLATIADGISDGQNYTKPVSITIHGDPTANLDSFLPADALISDWRSNTLTLANNGNWSNSYGTNFRVGNPIITGTPIYVDRMHQDLFWVKYISPAANVLNGKHYIATRNDSRNGITETQMSFTAKQNLTVYLAVEARINMSAVGWVDGTWEFMGLDVFFTNNEVRDGNVFGGVNHDGFGTHYLYRKDFAAGQTVRLGAINQGTQLGNMSFIIAPR